MANHYLVADATGCRTEELCLYDRLEFMRAAAWLTEAASNGRVERCEVDWERQRIRYTMPTLESMGGALEQSAN
jgi:hypothetical protein